MSHIAVQGGATGTGTVTVVAPSTSINRTLTLPDVTGTLLSTATPGVPVNGPAFSAYGGALQSLTTATFLKLQFSSEEFDTNSNYDAATNYRFTPNVAGYYQISSQAQFSVAVNATSAVYLVLYKNGSAWRYTQLPSTTAASGIIVSMSQLIYLNGLTDYIEMYAYQNSGSTIGVLNSNQQYNYFQASLVRSAV